MKKKDLFKLTLLAIAMFFGRQVTYSQVDPNLPKVIPPSPNAASLGIYGQIPVSLFNGLPQISIPIGQVNAGEISLPISLNYHGGGIKPDQHASWVGLGWDVNAGGVITRKVNGAVDEFLTHGSFSDERFGQYYNYAKGDNNNWAFYDTLYSYANPFGSKPDYPAPDEFIFNFGKYSGSFFYNHKGKWQVRSSDPISLTVKEDTLAHFSLAKQVTYGRNPIDLRLIFYKFTLTTPDGCKYIFGGTPESIEFTRNAGFDPVDNGDVFNANVVPTSWYLTKVINRKAQEINFTYQREGIIATVSSNFLRYQYAAPVGPSQNLAPIATKSASIINPSYLSSISAPNQLIKFSRSESIELPYDYQALLNPSKTYEDLTTNETLNEITNSIKWFKLDSISFYSDAATFLRKVAFSYKQQTTLRLMLDSLREIGSVGIANPPYKFRYDTTTLPDYNAQKLDHWGFYNGKNYFTTPPNPKPSLVDYDTNDVASYYISRNHNINFMKAGMLTSIKYPTGGITKFDYEPNEYKKIAKRYSPVIVTDTSVNVACGGLRIKSITNTDAFGATLTSKQYFYVRNYSNGASGLSSSGILAGYPQYLDKGQWVLPSGTVKYWFWYDFSIEPLSLTNGNHITYSEVVEKMSDGGYTINTFSNHDQSTYQDSAAVNGYYVGTGQYLLEPNISRSLDRGRLLTKSDFSLGNVLLRKVKYDYDTSAAKYSGAVRMVSVNTRILGDGYEGRATAYLTYTYPHFLLKETDSVWDQNGANPVVTVQNHLYNSYRLKTVDSTVNSLGDLVKTSYKYPFDILPANDPTGVYQRMVDSNFIEPVIEARSFVNSLQTQYVKNTYQRPYPWLFVPDSQNVQVRSNPIETRLRYYNYDTKGNILSAGKDKDFRTSYLWNYKQAYPIAEIKNASPVDIAYTSFESDSTGNWNNYAGTIVTATAANRSPSGNKYYSLTPSNTLVKSGLSPSKIYTVSYWKQNSGPLTFTGEVTGFPASGRVFNNWYYYEHKITGQSTITLTGTANIDEVRLYPFDAQMTTYTYDPVIGLTAAIDASSRITYYEYDAFQRLLVVRDQDSNVIKKYDYKYADPVVFYNKAQSHEFQRNNCTSCLIGSYYTYIIADSTYTSAIDQATADQLALDAVMANGQSVTNSTVTCHTPATASSNANTSVNVVFTIEFKNDCTGTKYNFAVPLNAVNYSMTPIPEGFYTVTIAPAPGSSGTFTYRFDNDYKTQSAPSPVTYLNVWMHGTIQLIIH